MNTSRGKGFSVGILANPASGRDIRRLVAEASVFPIAEKANMVTRLLCALGSVGVARALMMPDVGGIADRVRRAIGAGRCASGPELRFLDMPIEDGPVDTVRAVERMVEAGAGAIVVLGGDGTHRLVAKACGEVPLVALSTGTNNVFPAVREATIAGLAAGLVATGRVGAEDAFERNKVLRVEIDGAPRDLAVVDVSICSELWIGARALWRPETVAQVFVAFAEADAVGLSAVAGLLRPVSRRDPHGLRVDLVPPDGAARILSVPIAPGLISSVGIAALHEIRVGEPHEVGLSRGVIALDGEREIEFARTQRVIIRLDDNGPRTIRVDRVMTHAAEQGLLVRVLDSSVSGRGRDRERFTDAAQ